MDTTEPRYRLRMGTHVVGFMRQINGDMIMYSRDGMWWTGHKITHREVDEWTGYRDKNNTLIYEWDILYYKLDPDDDYQQGVVLWEEHSQAFGICDVHQTAFIPLEVNGVDMFRKNQLQVFSYLFLNPELQERLGARDE